MKYFPRRALLVFSLVLGWRVLLLIFTAQPVPDNDAYDFDGGVVNFLHGGGYCNPPLAMVFPISGHEVESIYPPVYQGALLIWMACFGTSALSAMALHLVFFALAGWITLAILGRCFPAATEYALLLLLPLGITFDDRPEGLAYIFGLCALWCAARQMADPIFRPGRAVLLALLLWLALYTSVIAGAFYFGVGFLACAAAGWPRRRLAWCVPLLAAALLFVIVTLAIVKLEPRWWAGFMENARQQSVTTRLFHLPHGDSLLKLIRTAPVFLLALAVLPLVWARRKTVPAQLSVWLALISAILVMGWILFIVSLTMLTTNYVTYVVFTQILLAAGLLALAQAYFPEWQRRLRGALVLCVLLVSVRAVGLSTWGAACAWTNSYARTQAVVRTELEPYTHSDRLVLLSSAFLYRAAELGVRHPIHSDWYFDHAVWITNAPTAGLIRCQPAKLILTQFDYYRSFEEPLAQLRQHPEWVDIQVRNLAGVRPPDAIPVLHRVLQHLSWAPVIVDLQWKAPPP